MAGWSDSAARMRSGVAGRSVMHPGRIRDRRDHRRRPDVHRQFPDPLAPWGAPLNGASTMIVEMRGRRARSG